MRPVPALNPPRHHCGYFAQLYRWPDGYCAYACPECHGEPDNAWRGLINEPTAREHFNKCNEREVEQWTL